MIKLRENEKLILVARRHWFKLTASFLLPLVAILTLVALEGYLKFNFFGYAWQVIAGILAVSALYLLLKIYIWRHNFIAVTDQRVVHKSQRGIFSSSARELMFRDITDITFRKKGFISLFGIGTLVLSTAGSHRLVMDMLKNPDRIIAEVNKLRGRPEFSSQHDKTPEL